MVNLTSDLRILFPTAEAAFQFAFRCEDMLIDIFVEQDGPIVTITGDGADHPVLREDLVTAAKTIHGDEIPAARHS